mmetsp:Transcript_38119/g.105210  ORF Transcript_38119/g.105210 Transcript_38119/m.105210 type:complete len:113 (+) Transcript_38119:767-1105(+)
MPPLGIFIHDTTCHQNWFFKSFRLITPMEERSANAATCSAIEPGVCVATVLCATVCAGAQLGRARANGREWAPSSSEESASGCPLDSPPGAAREDAAGCIDCCMGRHDVGGG